MTRMGEKGFSRKPGKQEEFQGREGVRREKSFPNLLRNDFHLLREYR
jgi:hypothetical protein